jgi:hypothetical protein
MVGAIQDVCQTMSDSTNVPVPPSTLALPRVKPLAGSKWAASFAGPPLARRRNPAAIAFTNAILHPDGRLVGDGEGAPARDEIVAALPAGGAVSLGQFLTGPLTMPQPGAAAHPAFCGPTLTPRQTDVLARLGLLRGYVTIESPQKFREILVMPERPGEVPGPEIKAIADRLRAPAAEGAGMVAILPARAAERFCLGNRASLSAWLRARRVTILDPESLRLADLAASLAGAALVLLADPRQAGLLGLCQAGAKVIEIAPEGWLGAEARCICDIFGLDWQPFLATPPSYALQGALPFGSLVPCSYEVPIRALAKVLP